MLTIPQPYQLVIQFEYCFELHSLLILSLGCFGLIFDGGLDAGLVLGIDGGELLVEEF
jgi:hypothetical protein